MVDPYEDFNPFQHVEDKIAHLEGKVEKMKAVITTFVFAAEMSNLKNAPGWKSVLKDAKEVMDESDS
jgi:hypothetical protein